MRLLLLVPALALVLTLVCRISDAGIFGRRRQQRQQRQGQQTGQQPFASTAPGGPAPGRSQRYGFTGSVSGPDSPQLLRQEGAGWMRVPLNWSQVEPRRGDFKWEQVERALANIKRTEPDIHVMVTLRAVSAWAGAGPAQAKVGSHKPTAPVQDMQAYYNFIYGMAQRGRGIVNVWQIENEIESQSFWAGTPEQYIELLRTANRAIRAADPQAKIALAGFTSEVTTEGALAAKGMSVQQIVPHLRASGGAGGAGQGGRRGGGRRGGGQQQAVARQERNIEFIKTVVAQAKDLVDIVDIHLYNLYQDIPVRVQWLRSLMQQNGYDKPIWSTEIGGPDINVQPYSEQAQAEQLVKRMVLTTSTGVQVAMWLGLTEMSGEGPRFAPMSVIGGNGQKKPAFTAFQVLTRETGNLPMSGSVQVANGGYGFRFGSRQRSVLVLWADKGADYQLEGGASSVRVTGIDGASKQLQTAGGRATIHLTSSPVFVEERSGPGSK